MDILHEIVANKRIEVKRQKEAIPMDILLAMGSDRLDRSTYSMKKALASSPFGIIAEFKRKSPSKGWLHPLADVASIVPEYEKAGASACSILTDGNYFGGSLSDLQMARKLVKTPLLRKDFIIDVYQLFQSRVMGADAVLLIAACLTEEECYLLSETAHSLQLEVLLEVHSEEELSYINPFVDMLGVNNRNLGSFHTEIENSFRMIESLFSACESQKINPLPVAESGISETKTIKLLREAGYGGFLIGETFMKTEQPGTTLHHFINELV